MLSLKVSEHVPATGVARVRVIVSQPTLVRLESSVCGLGCFPTVRPRAPRECLLILGVNRTECGRQRGPQAQTGQNKPSMAPLKPRGPRAGERVGLAWRGLAPKSFKKKNGRLRGGVEEEKENSRKYGKTG